MVKPIDKEILQERMSKHLKDFMIRRHMRTIADDRRK
jgi:hypothetical protein